MRPLTERHPDPRLGTTPDQRATTEDAFHRLAHWLAEVSAEAAIDPAKTAVGSTKKRPALAHTGEPSR
jgi:hypothetical protein